MAADTWHKSAPYHGPPPAGSGWGRSPAFVQSRCHICVKPSGAGEGLGDAEPGVMG